MLVLESEEHARARGARIYCEAAGWGLSADAYHVAAPDPSGDGIALALRRAVRDAGGEVADVVHVNAHATATVDGDLAEARALRGVLGGRPLPVTALKGHLGHLQGAAGGVEAVAAVLTLHHGVVPPTVGCGEVDDGIDLDVVRDAPRRLQGTGDLVLSNSFGFGGTTPCWRCGGWRSAGRVVGARGCWCGARFGAPRVGAGGVSRSPAFAHPGAPAARLPAAGGTTGTGVGAGRGRWRTSAPARCRRAHPPHSRLRSSGRYPIALGAPPRHSRHWGGPNARG